MKIIQYLLKKDNFQQIFLTLNSILAKRRQ